MGLLKPANTIICSGSGAALEPVRKSHFTATFGGPAGNSGEEDNYLLRGVSGLSQNITPGQWAIVNYPVSFPRELSSAEVVLRYFLLTDKSAKKSLFDFWVNWRDKCYDADNDLPALFNECVGWGEVTVFTPDGVTEFTRYYLSNCWPRLVVPGDMDRDSSEPLDFTVTLVVTRVMNN